MIKIPIVDGHHDLAENGTLFGRYLMCKVAAMRALKNRDSSQAIAALPELRRGGVALAFAAATPGFLSARWLQEKTMPITIEEYVRRHAIHFPSRPSFGTNRDIKIRQN